MKKVYIITQGEYSDYCIVEVFGKLEDAEKYCAIHNDILGKYSDPYELLILDLVESITDDIPIYRAIEFFVEKISSSEGSGFDLTKFRMRFSKKPFDKSIKFYNNAYCKTYRGIIPVNKSYDDEEKVRKIVFDELAKWEAGYRSYVIV